MTAGGGLSPPHRFPLMTTESPQQQIRQQALQLLSRREYSARELQQKLAGGHAAEDLAAVLEQLAEQGLQSDRRFAEIWVRHRQAQGFGPIRIQSELRQKGISPDQIQAAMEADGMDWFAHAGDVWQRRFRGRRERDPRLKAKQIRFLQYRGFTGEQIRHALGSADLELPDADSPD